MRVSLVEIFLVFLKVGAMIFGGGVVIIPLLETEAVQKRGWVTSEELVEYYAISQIIPGINIPDVAMFIGYKLRGKSGAFAAGLGIILIPFVLIILLSLFLDVISQNSLVKSATWGIEIGTIVILITTVRSIWGKSIVDKFSFLLFGFSFVVMAFTNFSPVWIVFVALFFGVIKGFLINDSEVE